MITNEAPAGRVALMRVENGFEPQRGYVSNIRGLCFKHTPSMFETFPGNTFSALEDSLLFKNEIVVIYSDIAGISGDGRKIKIPPSRQA